MRAYEGSYSSGGPTFSLEVNTAKKVAPPELPMLGVVRCYRQVAPDGTIYCIVESITITLTDHQCSSE